jgi:hypothetical protein
MKNGVQAYIRDGGHNGVGRTSLDKGGVIQNHREYIGYTDVRPGAHMFWWLMSRQGAQRPLVIWLQVCR